MFLGLVRMLYALCGSQGIDSREVTNYLTARHRLTRNHTDSFGGRVAPYMTDASILLEWRNTTPPADGITP
jgi:hypothetical protein